QQRCVGSCSSYVVQVEFDVDHRLAHGGAAGDDFAVGGGDETSALEHLSAFGTDEVAEHGKHPVFFGDVADQAFPSHEGCGAGDAVGAWGGAACRCGGADEDDLGAV